MNAKRSRKGASFHLLVPTQPRRKIYIYSDDLPPENAIGEDPGWWVVVNEINDKGEETTIFDTVEFSFERILMYAEDYAPKSTSWIDENTGEVANIYDLEFEE